MPRLPGRGGSQVIHPRWIAEMRPVAAGLLVDRAAITRAGTGAGTLNRATGVTTGPAPVTVVADTACRVELVKFHPTAVLTGEQRVTLRQYDVQVPAAVDGVAVDDVVTVTASEDGALVGRALRVLSVSAVSYEWTRVLRCQADEG